MDTNEQYGKVIAQLELLNEKLEKQSKPSRIFATGIVYGIGFFIGSAILATIALGMLGPIFGKIQWVKTNYETGTSILRSQ